MRSRMTAAGVTALTVLGLAGCVGIPTSGGVQDGPVIAEQLVPEFVALPSDPRPGSSPQEILTDFMQAARSPQGGYAIAQQFLASGVADDWNPDAGVLIATTPSINTVATDRLAYTVTSTARVNQDGLYREEEQPVITTLQFGFVQEGGEWRISELEDGIVLSPNSFTAGFRDQALYFFDPSFTYLVPDVRWFPTRLTASNRLVQALLQGPAQPLQQGVVTTAFPEATALGDSLVTRRSNTFVVDLSSEALAASAVERGRMRQQLAATLDSPNVEMTVRDADLVAPELTSDAAIINPRVDAPALVGTPAGFGYDAGSGVSPIDGLSGQLVAAGATGATGATLSADKQTVAFLAADGSAYVARTGQDDPLLIDDRGGLVVPSIDPFRFLWSAQAASAASVTTFEIDGTPHELQTGLPADAQVTSLDVSRDGTRLLLALQTPVGPRLVIAGIIRQENVPAKLGDVVDLPVSAGGLGDATWVDDRTVAAFTTSGEVTTVTAFAIGGPSEVLGAVTDARTIAGGSNGVDGLRVLRASGDVWRLQGSVWVNTGILTSFLATKQ